MLGGNNSREKEENEVMSLRIIKHWLISENVQGFQDTCYDENIIKF